MREDPRPMRAAIAPKVSNARHDTSVGRVAHLRKVAQHRSDGAYSRTGERPSRGIIDFLCTNREVSWFAHKKNACAGSGNARFLCP